jgi:hypothetical protein
VACGLAHGEASEAVSVSERYGDSTTGILVRYRDSMAFIDLPTLPP